ncbi:MAG: zonular occludens toxin, partial [Alteromonadaceae bacterium]|nr:zonular occludens toxin [Alteromonadaceae bacterium]
PPGSYKSSTAMWFEIVPALRQGRVVVSNLQGLKSLDEIQHLLGEVFPESTRLLRISIGNESGLALMRNFYHWLPIGAMIFIDEIQDVYPNDKSFKPADHDYKTEGFFDDHLPKEFIEIYHNEQRQIKNNVDIADYQDDLGDSLFDDRAYLRYPRTLRECFMRHRHYNWDILLATPDIKEVAAFIRSVCEVAYCHSSKDAIPVSYYKRRPRILEHLPKTNGLTVGKNDIVTFQKVPLDVFQLYQSTATGKGTKSGVGRSPFTGRLVLGFTFVVAYLLYMVFFFFRDDEPEVDKTVVDSPFVKVSPRQKAIEAAKTINGHDMAVGQKGAVKAVTVGFRDVGVSVIHSADNFVNLPYGASRMYLTGIELVRYSKQLVSRSYAFVMIINDEQYSINSMTLGDMGYQIFYKSPCLVELRSDVRSHYLYCEPSKIELPQLNTVDSPAVSLSLLPN